MAWMGPIRDDSGRFNAGGSIRILGCDLLVHSGSRLLPVGSTIVNDPLFDALESGVNSYLNLDDGNSDN